MPRETPTDALKTNAIYIGVVALLMALGLVVAYGAHMLLWGGDRNHELLTLVLVVGAALPGLLFLVVSGRAFRLKGKGVELDVGTAASEVAEPVDEKTDQIVLPPQGSLDDAISKLPRELSPLLKITLGTPRSVIEAAERRLAETGHTPLVVAVVDQADRVIAQIDTNTFTAALSASDAKKREFFDAIEQANARDVRKNWLASSVLPKDDVHDAFGHMVREDLDVMVLKNKEGKITQVVERRALRDRMVEHALAAQ